MACTTILTTGHLCTLLQLTTSTTTCWITIQQPPLPLECTKYV